MIPGSMRRSLDELARKGKPACSAHSVEPAPKSVRSAVPIATVAARTPIAVMILRLAKTSCRCAKRASAPGPAPFTAGYCLFPPSPASRWVQSPSHASTPLPILWTAKRGAMSASGGCRMTGSLQLEATRGGRARLSGLLDDMTNDTVTTHECLDLLSSEIVWTHARQPCRCVAGGGRAQRVFLKFPAGRKFNGGPSLFFLPVVNWIRILLTIY